MPIYSYTCDAGHNTEIFSSVDKRDEAVGSPCTHRTHEGIECRLPLRRGVSRTTFQLKGKGWYKDGYSKAGK